VETL
jgi:hypothetical protein